ncbi:MAG: hypothetical protein WCQ53_02395 [bacterium]
MKYVLTFIVFGLLSSTSYAKASRLYCPEQSITINTNSSSTGYLTLGEDAPSKNFHVPETIINISKGYIAFQAKGASAYISEDVKYKKISGNTYGYRVIGEGYDNIKGDYDVLAHDYITLEQIGTTQSYNVKVKISISGMALQSVNYRYANCQAM